MARWLLVAATVLMLARYPHDAPALLLLVGVGALVLWSCGRPSRGSVYHGHGRTRQDAAFHEAGHVVVARRRGASDVAAWVGNDGEGITRASRATTIDHAIILAAGQEAASKFMLPNPRGCHDDDVELEQVCRRLGVEPRQVLRIARREVGAHAREIRDVAERLNRRGHL